MTSNTIITYQAVLSNIAYNYALPPTSVSNEITIVGNPTSTSSIFTASPWTFILGTGYETSNATIYTLFTPDGSQWPSAVAVIPTFAYPAAVATVTYPSTGLAARQGVQTGSISIVTARTMAIGTAITLFAVPSTTISSSSGTSTSSSFSQSSSATPAANQGASSNFSTHSGLWTGVKVVIAAGCVLGALLVH